MTFIRNLNTKEFGKLGEIIALKLLKKKNYKILETNFRTRFGEIDIIAKDSDTLVFLEVKTRFSDRFGKPEEAVDIRKIKKIKRVAEYYLLKSTEKFKKMRIEVLAIRFKKNKILSAKLIKLD